MRTLSAITITEDRYFDKQFAKVPNEGECQVGIDAAGDGNFRLYDVVDGKDAALDAAARYLAERTLEGTVSFVAVSGINNVFVLVGSNKEEPEKLIAAAARWSEQPRRTWLARKLDRLVEWLDPAEFGGLLGAGR